MKSTFDQSTRGPRSIRRWQLCACFRALQKPLKGGGYCIGHSYFCGMQPEDVTEERLADIVECDLLPLLEEYWFDDVDKRCRWEQELRGALS